MDGSSASELERPPFYSTKRLEGSDHWVVERVWYVYLRYKPFFHFSFDILRLCPRSPAYRYQFHFFFGEQLRKRNRRAAAQNSFFLRYPGKARCRLCWRLRKGARLEMVNVRDGQGLASISRTRMIVCFLFLLSFSLFSKSKIVCCGSCGN